MSDFQLQQASESPGLQQASESPGRSAKTQIRLLDLFLHSEFQIQQERGEGSRLCTSNKLADDPGAAGPHAESTKLSPSFQIPRTECCPRERNTDHYLIISLNTHTQVCTHTHTHRDWAKWSRARFQRSSICNYIKKPRLLLWLLAFFIFECSIKIFLAKGKQNKTSLSLSWLLCAVHS